MLAGKINPLTFLNLHIHGPVALLFFMPRWGAKKEPVRSDTGPLRTDTAERPIRAGRAPGMGGWNRVSRGSKEHISCQWKQ